jgi:hypothetical protein
MAIRKTTHILKNTGANGLPSQLPLSGPQMGEPLVNLYDGILYFSGNPASTSFTNLSGTTGYFEVGSNLYDLKLRNKITQYEGKSGLDLVGKYLKGTSNGFVLDNITNIGSITGFTFVPSTNVLTIFQSNGTDLPVTLSAFTGLNLYGTTNVNGGLTVTGSSSLQSVIATNLNVTGTEIVNNLTITGTAYYNTTVTGTNPFELVNYTLLTAYTNTTDTYVTGGTSTGSTLSSPNATIELTYNRDVADGTYRLNYKDTFVTGGTYNAGSITFSYNDSSKSGFTVNGLTSTDTFVTGFTWSSAANSLTIKQNQGKDDIVEYINTFSGLSVSNLTAGQVVYVGSDGKLKTESDFAYNDSNNTLTIGTTSGKLVVNNGTSDGPSTFGQGGLTIGSGGSASTPGKGDLIVHGNFIVFGTGTTVATNELYVEDPQISLNYNPTGNTYLTSIASGIRVQDGSGLSASTQDVYFTIAQLNTLTPPTGYTYPVSSTPSLEYLDTTGYVNRGWLTQLNDIVIRNTNLNNGAPNGVRVLAEFDVLDGGVY